MSNVPDFRLSLAGRDLRGDAYALPIDQLPDLTPTIRPRLVSLTLTEKRGEEADQLDLVLDDTDGRLDLPATGAVLRLSLGWARGPDVTPGLVDKGAFVVDEVEHSGPPDLVTIRARSADLTGALRQRRQRSWKGTTLGAIVHDVASRHGLTPRCAPALAGLAVAAQAQSREGDLAFLRRIGREHDAVATVKRGTLILSPIGAGVTPSGRALPAATIHRRDGDAHSYRVEKRDDTTGVTAAWHDRKSGESRTVTDGKADGARRLSRTHATEAEARRAARAARTRTARQPISLSLTLALGRANLYPEQRVAVSGYRSYIDSKRWLLSGLTHSLSIGGFTTAIKLEAA